MLWLYMVMEGLKRARCVDGALRCGVGAVSSILSMHLACRLMSTAGNTFKDKRLSFAAPFFQCLPQPRQSEEVLPHQPEVVLSVLHVQSGGIFRSAMTCGRSLCRLKRHRTFHRTLFLPPLADACQSVRGLM